MRLDNIDAKILACLQADATRTNADIAEAVNLSANACWRRIKLLEENGYIRGRVALVDREKVNKALTVFVEVRTNQHDDNWFHQFSSAVRRIPEVIELHRLSGHVDYMLKLAVCDIKDYDRVYKQIVKAAPLFDVTSYISMETLKDTTEIPVDPV
ncbi:Lrp/AsnC family transcriptional regulator [Coralliovum pocilloporae]|uniref:Lrp/AsnC family transcriptional regulator n=1 Tax=Coralliovum pocilloporae TaxID=3066369 RepID=UPI003306BC3A